MKPTQKKWSGKKAKGSGGASPGLLSDLGKVRRSHVAGAFAPGAVADFRTKSGAPVSALVAGLEEWDTPPTTTSPGLLHPQRTYEPRLQKRLLVDGFRLPPIKAEFADGPEDVLPAVRFPSWLTCPVCERLARAGEWSFDKGKPDRRCAACSGTGKAVFAVPVRFVIACEDGHIAEFPWQRWIGCSCDIPQLLLRTIGAGLGGKLIECKVPGCNGKPQTLEGAFGKRTLELRKYRCPGSRPWLRQPSEEPCTKWPRVMQRGASSLYFACVDSALDIPPFSVDLAKVFGHYWTDLQDQTPEIAQTLMAALKLPEKTGKPIGVLVQLLQDWKAAHDADDPSVPLEVDEYRQLTRGCSEPVMEGEFEVRPENPPPETAHYMDGVGLARRLREVRAVTSFTRITPPAGPFRDPTSRKGRLCITPPPWLPAIELRGEGVFLRFAIDRVQEWEKRAEVIARAKQLADRRAPREADPSETARKTSPRFLLIHSFAHALIQQLSLTSGYSNAALRERLYVGTQPIDMAGILIHTGSADAEGTLGGLVRQGKQELLENTIRGLLQNARWCSSDPLCIQGTIALSSQENLAACHACLLVPETSCQHFNLLLDRAMLVGTPDEPTVGFFDELLAETT